MVDVPSANREQHRMPVLDAPQVAVQNCHSRSHESLNLQERLGTWSGVYALQDPSALEVNFSSALAPQSDFERPSVVSSTMAGKYTN